MNTRRWILVYCLATVLWAGCGQRQAVIVADRPLYPVAGTGATDGDIAQRLRAETARWHGTPHRLGGTDLSGVDCSGLVQQIYRDLFGIQMPRTARQQAARGELVGRGELEAGDLVFFKPPGKKDHVGIYLGKGEFVHTSAKRGVAVSRLNLDYWRKYYWTARRILP